jgi:hypothetical protein
MDVLANAIAEKAGLSGLSLEGQVFVKRLDLDMALKIGEIAGRSAEEKLRRAAMITGGDLLFVLPAKDGSGATAVMRLLEHGNNRFIEVRINGAAFTIAEEADIDPDLLGFARASLDVLERLRTAREEPDSSSTPDISAH